MTDEKNTTDYNILLEIAPYFALIMVFVAIIFLSYSQGKYDGMKELCKNDTLVQNEEGLIECITQDEYDLLTTNDYTGGFDLNDYYKT